MTTNDIEPNASDGAGNRVGASRLNALFHESVSAILRNQSENGAFVASPDFDQYHFCWLRDGSFSAFALDRAGEHDASSRYHSWVNDAIGGISGIIDDVIEQMIRGEALDPSIMPPARFGLDGTAVIDDWPNFQIDGYGTWLWSLGEHLRQTGKDAVPRELRSSVARAARYLATFALSPCYDVWEESGSAVHTSTLASVYGGLVTAARLLDDAALQSSADAVRERLDRDAQQHGLYVKSSENDGVDGSELWLLTPFGVVEPDDVNFMRTIAAIEDRLTLNGGVRRYASDVYFGSGAWPVLTASLGWHYVTMGNLEGAKGCLDWVASHFDADGHLGEQFGGELRDPLHYDEWVERWGPPAKDLTWSHAMFVVLMMSIDDAEGLHDSSFRGVAQGSASRVKDRS
jgi:GH15 family glucan-1,4-alpha-glucosidase